MSELNYKTWERNNAGYYVAPAGLVNISERVRIGEGAWIGENSWIDKGALIGEDVVIDKDARIDKDALIDKDARIDKGARVGEGAQIDKGARVGEGAWVDKGALIGEDVVIGKGAQIDKGALIDKDAWIGEHRREVTSSLVISGLGSTKNLTAHDSDEGLVIVIGCMNDYKGHSADETRKEIAKKYPANHPYFAAIDLCENWYEGVKK